MRLRTITSQWEIASAVGARSSYTGTAGYSMAPPMGMRDPQPLAIAGTRGSSQVADERTFGTLKLVPGHLSGMRRVQSMTERSQW